VIFPSVVVSLTVFAFNLLGDALRDVLDPRLRGDQVPISRLDQRTPSRGTEG